MRDNVELDRAVSGVDVFDVNISAGAWPFNPHRFTEVGPLIQHLKTNGIRGGLVSHLGGVFDADPSDHNVELAHALKRYRSFFAVPIVNPTIRMWREDLAGLPGKSPRALRILPSYHNYTLRDRRLRDVCSYAVDEGIPVCLQMRLDDERTRYFGLRLKTLQTERMADLAHKFADLTLVVMNAYLPELESLAKTTENVLFDTSFAEWLYSTERMMSAAGPRRVMFGSHTPLLETGASLMKVFESVIPKSARNAVASGNAARTFGIK